MIDRVPAAETPANENIKQESSQEVEQNVSTQGKVPSKDETGRKSRWFSPRLILALAPVLVAVIGVLGAGIGASLQGFWSTQLERQKFESSLIQKALETTKKQDAANNLKFLVDAGLIQGLDKVKIAELAETPDNLPTSFLTSSSQIPLLNPTNIGNRCLNPPLTAMLNYWPITFTDPADICHDYPAVDARLVNGRYSQSLDEWEAGRIAHAGDELFVAVWINNGAADNAEQIFAGRGTARNVRLRIAVDTDPKSLHYIWVQFAGDNTNTVSSRFKITTAENERLVIVPASGEIYDHIGQSVVKADLEIGNNIILIGDFKPSFQDGRFVRFRIKVIS